ncbi:MAG: DUF5678 domain-containing protein [Spirochaetota bacterium]
MDREKLQKEIDLNYEFFQKNLEAIMSEYKNKYVLIKNQEFIEYFNDLKSAEERAKELYDDGIYSIQQVDSSVIDLGIYSYA